jgi:uncharacterized protein (TIGR02145 family)
MNKRIKYIFLLLLLLIGAGNGLMAQQGFGTNAPHSSAVVEMNASNKGVLLPRVLLTATNIDAPVVNPVSPFTLAPYLLVFNETPASENNDVKPGFYYKNANWVRLLTPDDATTIWFQKGNAGTTAAHFLGTTAASPVSFRTGGIERMRIAATGSIGIGANVEPPGCALLELRSTTKGFLPPRMNYVQLNAIVSPADGLVAYNSTNNTLVYFVAGSPMSVYDASLTGSAYSAHFNGWVSGSYAGSLTTVTHFSGESFAGNTLCASKPISVSSCGGTTVTGTGGTYNLVEINGQCWMKEDSREVPSNYPTSPAWVNGTDNGSWGYYNSAPGATTWGTAIAGYGLLYQWKAAMNGATGERSRGACPQGFHVPSDCEIMYLEHGLGMRLSDQIISGSGISRGAAATVATDFKISNVQGGNNISGFTALAAGARAYSGSFNGVNRLNFWSSTKVGLQAYYRIAFKNTTAVYGLERNLTDCAGAAPLRCVKD